jgi:hypothetical protein
VREEKRRDDVVSRWQPSPVLANGEHEPEQQGGAELLSAREVVWWFRASLVAKGVRRRGHGPFYSVTHGARCTASVRGWKGGWQQGVGRERRWRCVSALQCHGLERHECWWRGEKRGHLGGVAAGQVNAGPTRQGVHWCDGGGLGRVPAQVYGVWSAPPVHRG